MLGAGKELKSHPRGSLGHSLPALNPTAHGSRNLNPFCLFTLCSPRVCRSFLTFPPNPSPASGWEKGANPKIHGSESSLSQKRRKSSRGWKSLEAHTGIWGLLLDPGRKIPNVLWEELWEFWGIPRDGRGAAPGDPPKFGEFSFPGSQDRPEAHPGFPSRRKPKGLLQPSGKPHSWKGITPKDWDHSP